MSTDAMISMLLCLGIVLGGFVYFLSHAIRKDRERRGKS